MRLSTTSFKLFAETISQKKLTLTRMKVSFYRTKVKLCAAERLFWSMSSSKQILDVITRPVGPDSEWATPLVAEYSSNWSHDSRGDRAGAIEVKFPLDFFLLVAAWICSGRSTLQSAEQWCQRRYGHKYQMMIYIIKMLNKTCKEATKYNKTIPNIQWAEGHL